MKQSWKWKTQDAKDNAVVLPTYYKIWKSISWSLVRALHSMNVFISIWAFSFKNTIFKVCVLCVWAVLSLSAAKLPLNHQLCNVFICEFITRKLSYLTIFKLFFLLSWESELYLSFLKLKMIQAFCCVSIKGLYPNPFLLARLTILFLMS